MAATCSPHGFQVGFHLALLAAVGSIGVLLAQPPSDKKAVVTAEASLAAYQSVVKPFLVKHCIACHGAKAAKGELDLEKLEPDMKTTGSAARWVVVLDQLVMGEMPPEGKPRPADDEIAAVRSWIQAEMKRSGKHLARREAISNGNLVPHHLLFDPKQSATFDAPARVRRLSPELYQGFTSEFTKSTGISQPFSVDSRTTFKDMGAPKLDEPTTVQLIRNALLIVESQTAHKVENGQVKGVGGTAKEFLPLLDEQKAPTDAQVEAAIKVQFERVLKRSPTREESAKFLAFYRKNVQDAGTIRGARYTLAAVFLLPEAIYRWEIGAGQPDSHGRVRLTPREIAFALAFALTDRRPDAVLLAQAEQGKLDTKEGVAAAVQQMLNDPKLEKPRILRFFREYFGYGQAIEVVKDPKENPDHDGRVLVEDTDRLVAYILEQDKNVLFELLTTNRSFVAWKTAADTKKKRAEAVAKFEAEKQKNPDKFKNKMPPKVGKDLYKAYNLVDFPDTQPVELPTDQRAGILTQPSWLVAFSVNDTNHAIHRGKWVRERLLGGVVPDVPITVDAQLPIAPEKTLRQRMEVTRQDYCWKCHQLMNNLGLPFEMYDHFGRYRSEELGRPVDATGSIEKSGGPNLDGDVKSAIEMVRKLAASEQVEQVFVRHAFRYWMGRNEKLGDAPSLQAAHRAYRESGGSMKALLVALLSSDSFLYRIPSGDRN